jgi:hypothetical protein
MQNESFNLVTPAQAGVQEALQYLDSGFRRDDERYSIFMDELRQLFSHSTQAFTVG